MKRTPLKRTKSLKSSSGPAKRGKRVKRAVWWLKDLFSYRDGVRREVEREARERVFGAKATWIRTLPCVIGMDRRDGTTTVAHPCPYWTEAAHATSRGSGGDSTHLIPLCTAHHHEQHTRGVETFAAKYGLELEKLAAKYESDWQLWQSTNNKEGDK
jgi:hypothetical protein